MHNLGCACDGGAEKQCRKVLKIEGAHQYHPEELRGVGGKVEQGGDGLAELLGEVDGGEGHILAQDRLPRRLYCQ